ncbi:type IV secretion system protein VirB2 [Agrobacterium larrymoorei]|uniref:Type IV secretion system protein VirB2 n=1 Tax=Agrobacterium larrymoorei TaxID=160699 RepID=A0AAJ2B911_9HYPH|nr:TrbC/VirB2 family protein [Agrobacterium larrymoorei]MDR6101730.1 type IV secretion system protein VirB2 [Agrobacterium larrymoorei]
MRTLAELKRLTSPLATQTAIRFFVAAFAILLLSTEPSLAQDFSGVTTFLDKIVSTITGPIGVAVSAIAVIAVGFSFMTGRMDWTYAVAVILGIAIVFGGASFVEGLSAS